MSDDLQVILAVIGGLIVLVSAAASTVAFYRANLANTTIVGLRGDRDDLTARVGRLEVENAQQAAEIGSLKAENATLRTLKDSTEAVERLATTIAAADQAQAMQHHDMLALIQTIPEVVTRSHEEVMAMIERTAHTHTGAA